MAIGIGVKMVLKKWLC